HLPHAGRAPPSNLFVRQRVPVLHPSALESGDRVHLGGGETEAEDIGVAGLPIRVGRLRDRQAADLEVPAQHHLGRGHTMGGGRLGDGGFVEQPLVTVERGSTATVGAPTTSLSLTFPCPASRNPSDVQLALVLKYSFILSGGPPRRGVRSAARYIGNDSPRTRSPLLLGPVTAIVPSSCIGA